MSAQIVSLEDIEAAILLYLEEKPVCQDSAAIFMCSMKPDDFIAARGCFNEIGLPAAGRPPYACEEVFSPGNTLAVFLRASCLMRPGLAECWRQRMEKTKA